MMELALFCSLAAPASLCFAIRPKRDECSPGEWAEPVRGARVAPAKHGVFGSKCRRRLAPTHLFVLRRLAPTHPFVFGAGVTKTSTSRTRRSLGLRAGMSPRRNSAPAIKRDGRPHATPDTSPAALTRALRSNRVRIWRRSNSSVNGLCFVSNPAAPREAPASHFSSAPGACGERRLRFRCRWVTSRT